jgi:phosphoribosylformimino-5-aminoimidazole carboxamide ribotide isomerase
MIVIPAIDLFRGQAVRLCQGSFDEVEVFHDDPRDLARAYAAAPWVHVVDLEGSRAGHPVHLELVTALAAIPDVVVQVGGGLRTADDVRAVIHAGAGRVVVGSLAVREPATFDALLQELGPERLVLAADVRVDEGGVARVAAAAWSEQTDVSAADLIARFAGLRHVLCTDIGRDGMLAGPNLDLYHALADLGVEVQASGGVSALSDLRALRATGVSAAIVGKALLQGAFTLEEALAC